MAIWRNILVEAIIGKRKSKQFDLPEVQTRILLLRVGTPSTSCSGGSRSWGCRWRRRTRPCATSGWRSARGSMRSTSPEPWGCRAPECGCCFGRGRERLDPWVLCNENWLNANLMAGEGEIVHSIFPTSAKFHWMTSFEKRETTCKCTFAVW